VFEIIDKARDPAGDGRPIRGREPRDDRRKPAKKLGQPIDTSGCDAAAATPKPDRTTAPHDNRGDDSGGCNGELAGKRAGDRKPCQPTERKAHRRNDVDRVDSSHRRQPALVGNAGALGDQQRRQRLAASVAERGNVVRKPRAGRQQQACPRRDDRVIAPERGAHA